jgi:hypothetical protein
LRAQILGVVIDTLRTGLKARNQRELEVLDSPLYSILNKKEILTPPIYFGLMSPKLNLKERIVRFVLTTLACFVSNLFRFN